MSAPERVDVNRLIFIILRAGVLLSIAVVLIGFALLAAGRPLPAGGLHPTEIPGELAAFQPAGFLGLGVLILISTPVARVFLSIFYFGFQRDRAYVLITLTVFLILVAGIVIGTRQA